MKIAKVIPIFKSGEKSLIESYRPISLLPVFSTIIEKLVKTRILSFISRHDVPYDRQNGFRKKRSTIYPLIDVISECYDNINSGNLSCVIALDIKKACDTVNFDILLYKLDYYGRLYVVHVTNSLIVI